MLSLLVLPIFTEKVSAPCFCFRKSRPLSMVTPWVKYFDPFLIKNNQPWNFCSKMGAEKSMNQPAEITIWPPCFTVLHHPRKEKSNTSSAEISIDYEKYEGQGLSKLGCSKIAFYSFICNSFFCVKSYIQGFLVPIFFLKKEGNLYTMYIFHASLWWLLWGQKKNSVVRLTRPTRKKFPELPTQPFFYLKSWPWKIFDWYISPCSLPHCIMNPSPLGSR